MQLNGLRPACCPTTSEEGTGPSASLRLKRPEQGAYNELVDEGARPMATTRVPMRSLDGLLDGFKPGLTPTRLGAKTSAAR